jgi:ATP-dependent Lhr-like helicase
MAPKTQNPKAKGWKTNVRNLTDTTQQFVELRNEHPWATDEATSLVRTSSGQLRWWTFAGGVANALLAGSLKDKCDVKSDNFSLSFPVAATIEEINNHLEGILAEAVTPVPSSEAVANLKFIECLSPALIAEVFNTRFNDPIGVAQALSERRHIVNSS